MEWTRKMYRVCLHRSMLILLFSSGVQPLAAIAQPLGRFSLTGSMAVGRSGHTATALPNGKVLIVGGNPANAGAISADAELYDFDVLFRSPGSNEDLVGLNWQQGASAVHDVPTYLQAGTWTITGVRAHENADDHSSEFFTVFATVTVEP